MRRRLHALVWVGILSGVFAASCLARRDKPFVRQTDDDAGPPDSSLQDADEPDAPPDALDIAPHAVLGIDPPHGKFSGETQVMIRGNGFAGTARVWFGDVEATDVTPVDPQRIQVVTPAGQAGLVDITVQNGNAESTRAVLTDGYMYDPFYAAPPSGPTSGGSEITIEGDRTSWNDETRVEIGGKPCTSLSVLSKTKLTCTTPAGQAGAKDLSVITKGAREDVLDGFTYGNSDNGFKGGLSGQALRTSKQLTVLAFDNFEGKAIPGVSVLLGTDVETGLVGRTDGNGVVNFSGKLGERQTVTLALKCFQPITFYDVDVDHVTAFLDPVLSPACGKLSVELPPGGGTPGGPGSSIAGEVVWPVDQELKRQGWSNVPAPASDTEKEVAYVFRLASNADDRFRLPDVSSAVTRDVPGALGYKFYQSTPPGNFTLYALAGLEDSSNGRKFTAYAMGILRGVAAKAGKPSEEVFIQVDVPLDHALTLTLDPPTPGPRGPDRIIAFASIKLQDHGFALLPSGYAQRSLPSSGEFSFVGVPPLVGSLAGAEYVLGARAVTGMKEEPPLSVIGSSSATTDLGGFVPLPVLTHPAPNTNWDMKSLRLEQAKDGQKVDLTIVRIFGGEGLYEWTLVAHGPQDELTLPDLGKLAPGSALPVGSLAIQTTLARIETFVYGSLRYRDLGRNGWNAYATDTNYTQH